MRSLHTGFLVSVMAFLAWMMAAGVTLTLATVPAQAVAYRRTGHVRPHVVYPPVIYAVPPRVYHGPYGSYPGPSNGPVWQGEPGDGLPIWRYGFYCGNDPDDRIRLELMRDCR
jgi:hypothetical protein